MKTSRKGMDFMMGFGRFELSELPRTEDAVNELQRHLPFSLTQDQFDALASFAYDTGAEALEGLKDKDAQSIAYEMLRYCYADGKKDPTLERRRTAESELFLSGMDRRPIAGPEDTERRELESYSRRRPTAGPVDTRRPSEYDDYYEPGYRRRMRAPEYDDDYYDRPAHRRRRAPEYDDYYGSGYRRRALVYDDYYGPGYRRRAPEYDDDYYDRPAHRRRRRAPEYDDYYDDDYDDYERYRRPSKKGRIGRLEDRNSSSSERSQGSGGSSPQIDWLGAMGSIAKWAWDKGIIQEGLKGAVSSAFSDDPSEE